MELQQYLQAARSYWWLLLVGALLGGAYGLYTVDQTDVEFRGSVTFFVRTPSEGTVSSVNLGDQFAQRRVNTYLSLVKTDRFAEAVAEQSGLDLSPGELRGRMSATSNLDTVLLTANVNAPTRSEALSLAEAIEVEFPMLVDQVESPDAGSPTTVQLVSVSGPSTRIVPVPRRATVLTWSIVGVALGAAGALVLELANKAVRSTRQLNAISAAPVIGNIPRDRRVKKMPLIGWDALPSARAEAFRELRTNLRFLDLDKPTQVVVVTSSVSGEGKTSTAANLAVVMAQASTSVLLIDADLRRPTLADVFALRHSVGSSEVLSGAMSLDAAIHRPMPNLAVLTNGGIVPSPAELLERGIDDLMTQARGLFEFVVIDTPPLLAVTDAAIVSSFADGVILVVEFDETTTAEVERSVAALNRVGARLAGFVVSKVSARATERYRSYESPQGSTSDRGVSPFSSNVEAPMSPQSVSASPPVVDPTPDLGVYRQGRWRP